MPLQDEPAQCHMLIQQPGETLTNTIVNALFHRGSSHLRPPSLGPDEMEVVYSKGKKAQEQMPVLAKHAALIASFLGRLLLGIGLGGSQIKGIGF